MYALAESMSLCEEAVQTCHQLDSGAMTHLVRRLLHFLVLLALERGLLLRWEEVAVLLSDIPPEHLSG